MCTSKLAKSSKLNISIRAVGTGMLTGLILGIAGCSSTAISWNSVPDEFVEKAYLEEYPPFIRFWGDEAPSFVNEVLSKQKNQSRNRWARQRRQLGRTELSFLVLSGGGSNGAYGAGVLNAWTKSGKRPQFEAVTGVSTGALIAPFAYLGSEYDHFLTEFYTITKTKDIMTKAGLFGLIGGTAIASNKPLLGLISKYVTEDIVEKIALEHKWGRRLWITTTNLEAGRPVIWNIGEIASSSNPDRFALIHKVLLASTAIPAAFPPVKIDVVVDGKSYQEVHVDGGTTNQAFAFPGQVESKVARNYSFSKHRSIYVIRNGHLRQKWKKTRNRTLSIAGRSISTLLTSQGESDMWKIYATTRRAGFKYQLTYIPNTFHAPSKEMFDTDYMNILYKYGYERQLSGSAWVSSPFDF